MSASAEVISPKTIRVTVTDGDVTGVGVKRQSDQAAISVTGCGTGQWCTGPNLSNGTYIVNVTYKILPSDTIPVDVTG